MTDEELDRLGLTLSREGFSAPYMARSQDYETAAELAEADREAERLNREALQRALEAAR